jgi:hypothetical protein
MQMLLLGQRKDDTTSSSKPTTETSSSAPRGSSSGAGDRLAAAFLEGTLVGSPSPLSTLRSLNDASSRSNNGSAATVSGGDLLSTMPHDAISLIKQATDAGILTSAGMLNINVTSSLGVDIPIAAVTAIVTTAPQALPSPVSSPSSSSIADGITTSVVPSKDVPSTSHLAPSGDTGSNAPNVASSSSPKSNAIDTSTTLISTSNALDFDLLFRLLAAKRSQEQAALAALSPDTRTRLLHNQSVSASSSHHAKHVKSGSKEDHEDDDDSQSSPSMGSRRITSSSGHHQHHQLSKANSNGNGHHSRSHTPSTPLAGGSRHVKLAGMGATFGRSTARRSSMIDNRSSSSSSHNNNLPSPPSIGPPGRRRSVAHTSSSTSHGHQGSPGQRRRSVNDGASSTTSGGGANSSTVNRLRQLALNKGDHSTKVDGHHTIHHHRTNDRNADNSGHDDDDDKDDHARASQPHGSDDDINMDDNELEEGLSLDAKDTPDAWKQLFEDTLKRATLREDDSQHALTAALRAEEAAEAEARSSARNERRIKRDKLVSSLRSNNETIPQWLKDEEAADNKEEVDDEEIRSYITHPSHGLPIVRRQSSSIPPIDADLSTIPSSGVTSSVRTATSSQYSDKSAVGKSSSSVVHAPTTTAGMSTSMFERLRLTKSAEEVERLQKQLQQAATGKKGAFRLSSQSTTPGSVWGLINNSPSSPNRSLAHRRSSLPTTNNTVVSDTGLTSTGGASDDDDTPRQAAEAKAISRQFADAFAAYKREKVIEETKARQIEEAKQKSDEEAAAVANITPRTAVANQVATDIHAMINGEFTTLGIGSDGQENDDKKRKSSTLLNDDVEANRKQKQLRREARASASKRLREAEREAARQRSMGQSSHHRRVSSGLHRLSTPVHRSLAQPVDFDASLGHTLPGAASSAPIGAPVLSVKPIRSPAQQQLLDEQRAAQALIDEAKEKERAKRRASLAALGQIRRSSIHDQTIDGPAYGFILPAPPSKKSESQLREERLAIEREAQGKMAELVEEEKRLELQRLRY